MSKTVENLVADSPLFMAAVDSEKVVVSISRKWLEQIDREADGIELTDLIDDSKADLVLQSVDDVFATNMFLQGLPVTCGTNPDLDGLLSIWSVNSTNDSVDNQLALPSGGWAMDQSLAVGVASRSGPAQK